MAKTPDIIPTCTDCFSFNPLFKNLTTDQLNILNYEKGCEFYKRGSVIYNEKKGISGVYCVNRGILKIYKTGVDGREKIIRFAKQGDIIGYRSTFMKESACTTAKVIEDATLCFIPASHFNSLVRENNEFAIEVLRISLRELGDANKFIIDIAQKTVRERLAEILVLLKDIFDLDRDDYLKVSLTREELANLVGTATESVIRLLSEFKGDKYIELNGRKIRILRLDSLKKLARIK